MLLLAQSLLRAIGFEYDDIEESWVARLPLRPLAAAECDEDRAYIMEALAEVRTILAASGYVYTNAAVNGRYVSIGPMRSCRDAA
jgi:hypothetical protein